jgi:hypothetical protein
MEFVQKWIVRIAKQMSDGRPKFAAKHDALLQRAKAIEC